MVRFAMRFRGHLRGTTRIIFTVLALLLCTIDACSAALAQATIHVPQDQPTIQAGIDAAHNGDTVLVSPGTYKVNLDFKGKAITLTTGATSYTAPAVAATILTPADVTLAIVTLRSHEGPGSVLNGFTLQNGAIIPDVFLGPVAHGDYSYEASVYGSSSVNGQGESVDASATITNNRFIQGFLGVALEGGEVAGNYFTGCVGSMFTGGGHIHDNVFEYNPNGSIFAGGLFERNIVRYNSVRASADSGDHNKLIYVGGVFLHNLVYGNYNQFLLQLYPGSGPPTAIVAENTFADNTVSTNAAPSYPQSCNYSSSGTICTPQVPLPTAAQIFFETFQGATPTGNGALIVNNIFSTGSPGPAIYCPTLGTGPASPPSDTLQFDHNLFNAATGPIFDPTCRQQIMASGNVLGDPLFVNAAAGDYHLSRGSPAIDTGNNSLLAELALFGDPLTVDYDGQPRPVDAAGLGYPVLDRGAFEFPGVVDAKPSSLLLTPSLYTPFTSKNITFTAALSSGPASGLGPPQGILTLLKDGVQVGSATARGDGTAVFSFAPPTAAGVHEFEADYGGLYPYTPATSLKLVLNFALSQTKLYLTASPTTGPPGTAMLLTVLAIADDGSAPTPVTLTDNGAPLATLLSNASGQATLNVTTFSPGTHTLVATYVGDLTHAGSTASVVVTIDQHDFTIALQPPSITLRAGQTRETNVLLTSLGSFADTLNLSAGAAPQYVTLSFKPATSPLSPGGTAVSILTISTGASVRAGLRQGPVEGTRIPFVLAALVAFPLACKRRRYLKSYEHYGIALPAFLAFVLFTSCVGCTDVRYALQKAAPGTYVVPVTATDPVTGVSHSMNLTFTVTPEV